MGGTLKDDSLDLIKLWRLVTMNGVAVAKPCHEMIADAGERQLQRSGLARLLVSQNQKDQG